MDKFVSRNNPFNILRKNHGITDSDVYDRLEAYENTGLEPDEIERLREAQKWTRVEEKYPTAKDVKYINDDVVWLIKDMDGKLVSVALPWKYRPNSALAWQPLPEPILEG